MPLPRGFSLTIALSPWNSLQSGPRAVCPYLPLPLSFWQQQGAQNHEFTILFSAALGASRPPTMLIPHWFSYGRFEKCLAPANASKIAKANYAKKSRRAMEHIDRLQHPICPSISKHYLSIILILSWQSSLRFATKYMHYPHIRLGIS